MNKEITENYYISNGMEFESNQIDQISITQPSIYEVIRVIDGVPIFLEDHMERLQNSAASLESKIQNIMPRIASDIKKLIKINNYPEKNIKLLVFNLENEVPDYIMCFIKSTYPSQEQYLHGISSVLFHAERSNPNAKIINNQLRETINLELKENNAYEALLVNNKGEITEGSRSNLFFVVHGKIYTSPAHDVLIGITRKYIIEACSNLRLEIIEQPIPFSMLDYADGAFITGTSPKVLPIASVEERELDSANNQIVKDILAEYNNVLEKYILEHK
ncbi:MAG: branched-chain amino acid aminotransferase [Clostridia bacterium]|jgi:branched-chain amino acid aminotransferase|nr:branched-chain amino acid aminotransferase [Clostridia bacterium]